MLDKNFSHQIEWDRLQYSCNARGPIKGIGLVNCDGKSKRDHVQDVLAQVVQHKPWTCHAAQDAEPADQEVRGGRRKIEQFHRELKQTMGIKKNPCRKARIQRKYIACAMLVWLRLTDLARQTGEPCAGSSRACSLTPSVSSQQSAAQQPLRQDAFCVSSISVFASHTCRGGTPHSAYAE